VSEETTAGTGSIEREFVISNQYGIHARPAALFVKAANRFDADVTVEKNGNRVSGKSIMGLMTLEAARGTRIRIIIEGPEAAQAMDELQALIEGGFDEE
jgi:phosphocarrier protein HPr